jgi:hypothetical protein
MRYGIALSGSVLLLAVSPVASSQPSDPLIVLEGGGIQFPDESILDTADHSYAHLVVVAKNGGRYSSINEAVTAIANNPTEPPSESSTYLVWVAPGVYEEQVTMASYVDIQGAGRDLVTIRSTTAPTVTGAAETTISHLTIECDVAAGTATAMKNTSSRRIRLEHVDLIARGGSTVRGIWNNASSTDLVHVTIDVDDTALAYGVEGEANSGLSMVHSEIRANAVFSGGVAVGIKGTASSYSSLTHSQLTANANHTAYCIQHNASGATITDSRVAAQAQGEDPTAQIYCLSLENSSSASLTRSIATALAPDDGNAWAVYADGGSHLRAEYSHLSGYPWHHYALWLQDASSSARNLYSRLEGSVGGTVGIGLDLHCYGCVNRDLQGTYHALDTTCQLIPY